MASRKKSLFDPKLISLTVVIALLAIVAIGCVMKLKSDSYAKITPTSMEIVATALTAQNLTVDYDYGYGFNPAHRQVVRISEEPQTQVKRVTISAWKSVLAVQVKAENPSAVTLQSVTLQRGTNVLRIVSPEPSVGGVVMVINDIPAEFASSIVGG